MVVMAEQGALFAAGEAIQPLVALFFSCLWCVTNAFRDADVFATRLAVKHAFTDSGGPPVMVAFMDLGVPKAVHGLGGARSEDKRLQAATDGVPLSCEYLLWAERGACSFRAWLRATGVLPAGEGRGWMSKQVNSASGSQLHAHR